MVASHWAVDDKPTAVFFERFYAGLQEESWPAAALRGGDTRHIAVPTVITSTPIQIHTTAGVTIARSPIDPSLPTFMSVRYRSWVAVVRTAGVPRGSI